MIFGNRPLSGAARVDRNIGQFDELLELGAGMRPEQAVAAHHQRALSGNQHFQRAVDFGRVARGADLVGAEIAGAPALLGLVVGGIEYVLGNFEQRHPLGRRKRVAEGGAQVEFDRRPVGYALGVFGEARHHVGAVSFLE